MLDTHFSVFPEFYSWAQLISKQPVIQSLRLPFLLCLSLYHL